MIEVKNVTKKYPNITAVDNVSFEVKDGEVVGFLGPNGAGKSTTMNMITGFIEPTEGQIIVNGYDMGRKPKKAKKQIGYMPEGVPLYTELTVKEFVNYMAELRGIKSKQKKETVIKTIKETGLNEVQNKLIRNLSRGYKQRVGLAGALVGEPDVIILDEPTVGLDPKQITEIRNLIKELGKKHTVILSTHILSEVSQICERVIIINHGKIIAIDTPENLEKRTKEKNAILVTIEDKNEKIEQLKEQVKEIEEIKLIKENEDGTKQYEIISDEKIDLRKTLFDVLPKQDITILELKKNESTLEQAFLKLVDNNTEQQEQEAKEQEKQKEEKKRAKKQEKEKKKEEKTHQEQTPKADKKKEDKEENKKQKNKTDKKKGGDK